jgi:hypothetical protein
VGEDGWGKRGWVGWGKGMGWVLGPWGAGGRGRGLEVGGGGVGGWGPHPTSQPRIPIHHPAVMLIHKCRGHPLWGIAQSFLIHLASSQGEERGDKGPERVFFIGSQIGRQSNNNGYKAHPSRHRP